MKLILLMEPIYRVLDYSSMFLTKQWLQSSGPVASQLRVVRTEGWWLWSYTGIPLALS